MIYNEQPEDFIPELEIVGCFVECSGKILLLHRLDNKSEGSKWGTPGGKIDKEDKDVKAAIQREIKEETGLILNENDLNFYKTFFVHHPWKKFIYHNFYFNIKEIPEIIISEYEHKAFAWVTPEEALKMPLVLDEDHCIKDYYGIK